MKKSPGQVSMDDRPVYWRQHFHVLAAMMLLPLFASVYYLDFWLRFEGEMTGKELRCFQATINWVLLVKLAWFVGLRACKGWRRSVTFYDLVILFQAATGALLTMSMIQFLLGPLPAVPRSVFLLDWGATIVVLGGTRSLLRGFHEVRWSLFSPAGQVRVLIAGAGEMGMSMLRMIRRAGQPRYQVVGFLDRNAHLLGTRVDGVAVLGGCEEAKKLVEQHRIRQILVVQGAFSGPQLRHLMDDAHRGGCEIRVVPNDRQLIEGSVVIQPRSVSIEDLLQREPVELDIHETRRWIDGRVILVTGSAGSIGSEICRQLLRFSPQRIVLLDRAETGQFFLDRELQPLANETPLEICVADVLDEPRMRRVLMQHRPQVIFHAAAYKHVPLME